MKMQYRLFIPLLLTAGCFAHKEAPDRLVSARGIEEAEAAAAEVESVDLSGPGAAALPASLPAMPKLKVLYLRDGAFTNFSALAGCAALETLDLGNVRLGALPGEVLSLPALRDLYLSGCGLAAFPEGLEGLPHLRYLNLDRNRISKLPDALPPHLRWRSYRTASAASPDSSASTCAATGSRRCRRASPAAPRSPTSISRRTAFRSSRRFWRNSPSSAILT